MNNVFNETGGLRSALWTCGRIPNDIKEKAEMTAEYKSPTRQRYVKNYRVEFVKCLRAKFLYKLRV
ncbi:hypothetical protein WN944_002212 [Citrus x changshan-huyou]|uniref:Uncharacterized protein n=1 Tax=Citrus x changshan-huyou TaxID=2935761 RepID=A0AAP0QNB0_9ROSI